MTLEPIHFPSDPDSSTGNLRVALCRVVNEADAYPGRLKLIKSMLTFALANLTKIEKIHFPKKRTVAK